MLAEKQIPSSGHTNYQKYLPAMCREADSRKQKLVCHVKMVENLQSVTNFPYAEADQVKLDCFFWHELSVPDKIFAKFELWSLQDATCYALQKQLPKWKTRSVHTWLKQFLTWHSPDRSVYRKWVEQTFT